MLECLNALMVWLLCLVALVALVAMSASCLHVCIICLLPDPGMATGKLVVATSEVVSVVLRSTGRVRDAKINVGRGQLELEVKKVGR